LLYKLDVFLARKHLRHAVGWHLVCGSLLYIEAMFLDLLADLALVDVDVFEFRTKFVLVFCDYPHRLLIVTLNDRRLVEL
jgi:hypothetical protein